MIQDLRYGLRMLLKHKGFTLVAVLSLGLGIGANTAIFSLIDAVLLRMLPVSAPEQLFILNTTGPDGTNPRFSYPAFQRLSEALPQSAGLSAISSVARFNASISGGGPESVQGQLVSGEWFDLLGVRPAVGRLLESDDNRSQGGHPVAVLSYGFWERRFGNDRGVIGLPITLSTSISPATTHREFAAGNSRRGAGFADCPVGEPCFVADGVGRINSNTDRIEKRRSQP